MNTIVRLAAHSVAFTAFAVALHPRQVAPAALVGVFVVGFAFLLWAPRQARYPRAPGTWLATFLYALLLAVVFAGADSAMEVLGNSIKPRASLPAALGGLELYWLLVFGVASVAFGAFTGAFVEHWRHAQTGHVQSVGSSEA